jgi:purine-cytosine permease-like protein
MSLVMGWLAKSRQRVRPESEVRTLANPPGILIVGVVCFALFAGAAIVSNVFPNKTVTWWTTAIFAGFALMGAAMIADYFMARHTVSEQGLRYRKLTGARMELRWAELKSVRYSPGMKWFRLETQSGQVARISAMLMGLPEFARLLLAHGPRQAIAQDTIGLLEATASGRPPAVWG